MPRFSALNLPPEMSDPRAGQLEVFIGRHVVSRQHQPAIAAIRERHDNPNFCRWRPTILPSSWFKKDFFKWTNKPPCSGCGARGPEMLPKQGGRPTPAEMSAGAARVEVYECKNCHAQARFPRYNHPAKLLETRTVRNCPPLPSHPQSRTEVSRVSRWIH